jgi:AcrR family transcriptional regulator
LHFKPIGLFLCKTIRYVQKIGKAEATRRKIIEKAAPLFNTQGVAGTSIGDIMRATKLAKGGIYGNFASKEELSAEAFDFIAQAIEARLREVAAGPPSLRGKLLALLDFYDDYPHCPVVAGGCPVLNFGPEADDTLPVLRQKAVQLMEKLIGSLEQLVLAGQKRGEFAGPAAPRAFAVRMYAGIQGGMLMSRLQGHNQSMKVVTEAFRQEIAGW